MKKHYLLNGFSTYLLKSNDVCERFVIYPSVVTITLGILGTLAHFRHFSGPSDLNSNPAQFIGAGLCRLNAGQACNHDFLGLGRAGTMNRFR